MGPPAHQANVTSNEDGGPSKWEGSWRVLPHARLPVWLQDNEFLVHGHRPPLPSVGACLRSVFRLHTETANIWTHLLGFVLFVVLGLGWLGGVPGAAPLPERLALTAFFVGALLCLAFSCLFHTLHCHSERLARAFSRLDYWGITLLTVGSLVPWLHYAFECAPCPRRFYQGLVCALGLAAARTAHGPCFSTPPYRAVRTGVFAALGLSALAPALHVAAAGGSALLGGLVVPALLYALGAALYAARVPERFCPGRCDIWFHSHQLFHVLVVAAAVAHLRGLFHLRSLRATPGGTCAPDPAR